VRKGVGGSTGSSHEVGEPSPGRKNSLLQWYSMGMVRCYHESQISLLEGGRWLSGVAWRVGFCSSFLIDGAFDADFRGVACASSPRTMALRHGNLYVPFFEHLELFFNSIKIFEGNSKKDGILASSSPSPSPWTGKWYSSKFDCFFTTEFST
jgi:hypothetical protein